MFGLGKPRSKLGKFIDRNRISQGELAKASGKSRNTISSLCDGGKSSEPYEETQIKVVSGLRKLGFDVRPEDFWP